MVQISPATGLDENGYDNPMKEEERREEWTEALRRAVGDFAAAVGESSRSLGTAAERFAGQAVGWVEQLTGRAQDAAAKSQDMAAEASRAAEDARRAGDSVREAVEHAKAELMAEAARAVQEAVRGAIERSEASRAEASKELAGRAEMALKAAQEAAESAARAADDARRSAESVTAAIEAAAERLQDQATKLLQDAAERIEERVGSVNEAAERALKAARDARETREQHQATQASGLGATAAAVLDRLESDYRLLARLVRELHERTSLFGAPVARAPAAPTASDDGAPEDVAPLGVEDASEPAPAPEVGPADGEDRPEADQETPWNALRTEGAATEAPIDVPLPAAGGTWGSPAEAGPPDEQEQEDGETRRVLEGRVILRIVPVRDFDRLLSLDAVLGRMGSVRSVTLADHAHEEVTFRIELNFPVTPDALAEDIGATARSRFEVVSHVPGELRLRMDA